MPGMYSSDPKMHQEFTNAWARASHMSDKDLMEELTYFRRGLADPSKKYAHERYKAEMDGVAREVERRAGGVDPTLAAIRRQRELENEARFHEEESEKHAFRAKVESERMRAMAEEHGPEGGYRVRREFHNAESTKRVQLEASSREMERARAIRGQLQTGVRGGKYYVTASGEKHYVGNNEQHDAAQTTGKGPWQR